MTVPPASPGFPPPGAVAVPLLHLTAECSVDALFEDFFGSYPELQAKLHVQRNDTNCAESPWVSSRADLPAQQFAWPGAGRSAHCCSSGRSGAEA
jgi:hypothetical protein